MSRFCARCNLVVEDQFSMCPLCERATNILDERAKEYLDEAERANQRVAERIAESRGVPVARVRAFMDQRDAAFREMMLYGTSGGVS